MKASELVKELVDAIALEGDRDVWLNVGGIQPIGEVFPDGLTIYIRSETVAAEIADHRKSIEQPLDPVRGFTLHEQSCARSFHQIWDSYPSFTTEPLPDCTCRRA